jgi:hypothetical protein
LRGPEEEFAVAQKNIGHLHSINIHAIALTYVVRAVAE